MILDPKKIKSVTVSTFSPSIYHEVMGLDAKISGFFFFFLCCVPSELSAILGNNNKTKIIDVSAIVVNGDCTSEDIESLFLWEN